MDRGKSEEGDGVMMEEGLGREVMMEGGESREGRKFRDGKGNREWGRNKVGSRDGDVEGLRI